MFVKYVEINLICQDLLLELLLNIYLLSYIISYFYYQVKFFIFPMCCINTNKNDT